MMLFAIKRAFLWAKHHWVIIALIAYTAVMWLVFRRNVDAAMDVLTAKQKSYNDQIAALKDRHHEEILKKDKLFETYKSTIGQIEEKFAKQQKELKVEEKQRVKERVASSKGEPDVIKAEIEEMFGFAFVDPVDP